MSRLKKLDEVAYVRFASVYRQFKDITPLWRTHPYSGREKYGEVAQRRRTPHGSLRRLRKYARRGPVFHADARDRSPALKDTAQPHALYIYLYC